MHDKVDGLMSSKNKSKDSKEEGHESVSSVVQRFSQLNLIPGGLKPPTPTSPVSAGNSPFSLPSHLKNNEETGDFNSIERGEKLSHLTAGRVRKLFFFVWPNS